MKTFVAEVRYGNGSRFDPILEERGGWIAGEAQKLNVEMTDAMIEVMAVANNQGSRDVLIPFKEKYGEILPSNLEMIFYGFWVRKDAITFKVNSQKVD